MQINVCQSYNSEEGAELIMVKDYNDLGDLKDAEPEEEKKPLAVWDPEVGMYISSELIENEFGKYVYRKDKGTIDKNDPSKKDTV